MSAVVLALVVAASGATNESYSAAHAEMKRTGRPLLVLVGADYCPGCRTMKHTLSQEQMAKRVLGKVAFAKVDTENQTKLARKLLRGSSIPQLVMFRRTKEGWKATRLVGAKSEREVETFVSSGLKDAVVEPESEEESDEGDQDDDQADQPKEAAAAGDESK